MQIDLYSQNNKKTIMSQSMELKIFIVDDDPFYLEILKQITHNLGFESVTKYENGTACLNKLNEKPDVIFLDYKMDTLTGYDVLKKIKRYDPNIYVVMISSQEEVKPAIDTLKHGAFDYLQKGDNDENEIKQVLEKIIKVKDLIKRSKPNFLKSIFKFL